MLARYFLIETGDHWIVTFEGRVLGRFGSRTEATEAAVVMADLMGAMHHDADVMVSDQGRLDLVWSYADKRAAPRRRSKPAAPAAPRHVQKVQRGSLS